MTNPMLAELDAVVRLMEKATGSPWACGLDGHGGVSLYTDDSEPLQIAFLRASRHNTAKYVAALHNFLRTHHAALADMAKRLEAAERDSKRLDWLESQREAYGFENCHEGNRWVIDGPFATVRRAIDATQEGEG